MKNCNNVSMKCVFGDLSIILNFSAIEQLKFGETKKRKVECYMLLKFKKMLALTLIATLLLTVIAGCKNNNGSNLSSSTTSSISKSSKISSTDGVESSETSNSESTSSTSIEESSISSGGSYTQSVSSSLDQTNEEETVNLTIRNAFAGWEFDKLNDWSKDTGLSTLIAKNGYMNATISNDNSSLLSPGNLKIPTQSIRTIEFRMRSTVANSIKVYWKSTSETWAELKSATINIHADNRWHDYQMELSLHEQWIGQVDQIKVVFPGASSGIISVDYWKFTGLYFVPFVMFSGNAYTDIDMLKEMKSTFANSENTAVVGFSAHLEFLSMTNAAGNYEYSSNLGNPEYFIMLAKQTGMPVMMWLRGDPWGYQTGGIYNELWSNDVYCMWTSNNKVYRSTTSGYGYLCMAKNDLAGKVTRYWAETEKLLGQCSKRVNELIQENPGCILGITTSSEIKFNADESDIQLDYNPKTIKEFRDWSSLKYNNDLTAFNTAMNTNFQTWQLLSTDYNPSSYENLGGFDAPRTGSLLNPYWSLWTEFRRQVVANTVKKQVEIIAPYIDSKYIYTHQIDFNDEDKMCSPIETGNVPGSNIGLDTGNTDVAKTVATWLKGDYSRSWGIPEIFYSTQFNSDKIYTDTLEFFKCGIKYLAPLAWGDITYTVQGSEGETAWKKFLKDLDRTVNFCTGGKTSASSYTEGYDDGQLVDANLNTGWSSESAQSGQWISVDMGSLKTISSIVLYPDENGLGFPVGYKVEISTEDNDNPSQWITIKTENEKTNINTAQIINFNQQKARHIKITGTNLAGYMRLMELKAFQ